LTRVVVAPLRIGRADADVQYLSFGLAEAVAGSLASLSNIVVRAPAVAAKWNDEQSDPRQLAADADVDLVVSGTLLRSGIQLRITAQLIDASSGTMLGATTDKGSTDDIFALEDALTSAATGLLSPHLTPGPRSAAAPVHRDVPANPRAFELFLRGMEEARSLSGTPAARELFQKAVEEDPRFAPAWAGLGRSHRVWGKYYQDREGSDRLAEEAFKRAFELSPELPLAHRYFTHFESEHGRAADAIVRLLKHAATNRHDAQLFAGLVHALRYAGLFDASIAAHEEAKRLDPNVATGVEYTHALLAFDARKAAPLLTGDTVGSDAHFALAAIGDEATAARVLQMIDVGAVPPAFRLSLEAAVALHTEPAAQAIAAIDRGMNSHYDPEALFLYGGMLVRAGDHDRGVGVIRNAIDSGYWPVLTLANNRTFDGVREHTNFKRLEDDAQRGMRRAQRMFEDAGGPEMLGLPAATRLGN
jgi:TolB-like protein/tetratricopeptide (TPR) repeat protein